jgi:hypothetical protein
MIIHTSNLIIKLEEIFSHDLRSRSAHIIWSNKKVVFKVRLLNSVSIDNSERSNAWMD